MTDVQVSPNPAAQSTPSAVAQAAGAHRWVLPERGDAIRLVTADYERAARELGVETAAVHAVASVEAGGRTGFDARNRPKIRYENHYFRRLTNRRYDRTHPNLSCAYNSRQYRLTHGRNSDQYALLHEAFALAPAAAVESCSWGMFQVVGENYRDVGWTDLEQFTTDMFYSEAQHLRAFLGFCRHNNLVRHLRTHNWTAFARAYNGPAYADNAYDVKMRTAYQQYSRSSSR